MQRRQSWGPGGPGPLHNSIQVGPSILWAQPKIVYHDEIAGSRSGKFPCTSPVDLMPITKYEYVARARLTRHLRLTKRQSNLQLASKTLDQRSLEAVNLLIDTSSFTTAANTDHNHTDCTNSIWILHTLLWHVSATMKSTKVSSGQNCKLQR